MNQTILDQNENRRIWLRKEIKDEVFCVGVMLIITLMIMVIGYNIASNSYDNSVYGYTKCNSRTRIACLSNCGCAWCGECLNANNTKWCTSGEITYADFCPKDSTGFYIYAFVLFVPAIIMAAIMMDIRDKCAELRLIQSL